MNMIWSEKMHFTMHILPLGFIFENFHHKQRGLENVNFLSAHFSSSFGSHFLLFWLKLPPPNTAAGRLHISVQGGGNVSLRRRKYEDKEEEIWADKNRRFAAA